jgi:UDP-N-acetylmuramoyl-L-alanyl-D-glutamate--2,6-diaminopimelate ligase
VKKLSKETVIQSSVTVRDIAQAVEGIATGTADAVITDVTHDSRQARDGSLFAAIRGLTQDGHRFIPRVMEAAAAAILSEQDRPQAFNAGWIQVENVRRAMAYAAAEVHGHPSRDLQLVGVTGTNGKTTTAYLVAAIASAAGEPPAMTTTVEYRIGDSSEKAERTTPEATDMQRFLRRAVGAGCRTAVMECSSQAMDLHRCDALRFSVAIFTNLTRDHLDYHGTMANYFYAKKRLFDGRLGEPPRSSVINLDDEGGIELEREIRERGGRIVTYALRADADVTASDVQHSLEGMRFHLKTPAGDRVLHSPLVGRPHIYNIMAATAAGIELGYDLDVISDAIQSSSGAPGRFERVGHAGDFAVVVDYAHTDDALLNVLNTARGVSNGRIITVFGCGGDRDTSKRAPMGEAAGSLSDVVILTSDNPRTENPEKILSEVEVGLRSTAKPYHKIADRREAIRRAIAEARTGDVVLIAGKGHEDYQIIGKEVHHFDDKEVAREFLSSVN